jgi:hypothetical protein
MTRITQIIGASHVSPEVLDQDVLEQKLYREGRFKYPTLHSIFVFGSNEGGHHGAGAARYARSYKGATMGIGFGRTGQSFAIPTKDRSIRHTLPLSIIQDYVNEFIKYARRNSTMNFQVTQIGCGLAGLKKEQIAPMFALAPNNCHFDTAWSELLPNHTCWGTFP